jgi:uncharacterized membrane protein YtjA (UPF0391 family)
MNPRSQKRREVHHETAPVDFTCNAFDWRPASVAVQPRLGLLPKWWFRPGPGGCATAAFTVLTEIHIPDSNEEVVMLYWALMFLVIALVAGALGFFNIAGAASGIAQILFFVFLVLFIVSLVTGGIRRPVP